LGLLKPRSGQKGGLVIRPKQKSPKSQHGPDFRVEVVKTSLEKNLSVKEARKLYGVGSSTWYTWKRIYSEEGEEALRKYGESQKRGKKALPPAVQEKLREHALEVKRKFPYFGVLRVWKWLLRTAFLPVSFRQVRSTLAEADLIAKPVKKKRKPRKPRGFERVKPNDLWATDITEFQLAGGMTVYVIAFIDDHSRYIVSWGIYAGCSGELVLEVLRKGIGVYGRPNDMLSDHGPQFWVRRGKTQFQKFLQREDITDIKASTPEGNGKIEAFWASMKEEFVEATKRKGDLEEVRDRLAHWMNFYNFQRPHGEIDCTPAERYFQYQEAMKAEIQKRIRKNELELALSKTPPSQILGGTALGQDKVEVRKEDGQFIVRLGDQVLNKTDLDRKKESTHEPQEAAAGSDEGRGPGRKGEGVAGAPSTVGGEVDLGCMPGDGLETALLLQAGGADGPGDGDGGGDAGRPRTTERSADGSDESGAGDGRTPAGASETPKPDENLQEGAPHEGSETPEKRPEQAKTGPSDGNNDGDAGAGPAAGQASPPSGDASLEKQQESH
jgi:putative transposase